METYFLVRSSLCSFLCFPLECTEAVLKWSNITFLSHNHNHKADLLYHLSIAFTGQLPLDLCKLEVTTVSLSESKSFCFVNSYWTRCCHVTRKRSGCITLLWMLFFVHSSLVSVFSCFQRANRCNLGLAANGGQWDHKLKCLWTILFYFNWLSPLEGDTVKAATKDVLTQMHYKWQYSNTSQ